MGIRKGKNDYKCACRCCNVPEAVDHLLLKCSDATNKKNKINVNYIYIE